MINVDMEIELIGVSQNIELIRKRIDQVVDTDLNIIVFGETGVGKEVVVRSLYQKSKRRGKPFVKVNCAALPDTLLESEMFGYEKGAFTGALKKMRGKFEQAHGGVLFLDEIGDMPLSLQSKLLHAIQDGDFTRLGSEKTITTDIWVIAATNHNLEADIDNRRFRMDLYQRLNEIKIYIEPLRNRPEDIPHLIDYFAKKYHNQIMGESINTINTSMFERLMNYHWPGNVRELQNILKCMIVLGESKDSIDELFRDEGSKIPTISTKTFINKIASAAEFVSIDCAKSLDCNVLPLKQIRKKLRNRIDEEMISYALKKTHWNRLKAAKMLDVSYKWMYNKIDEFNIKPIN